MIRCCSCGCDLPLYDPEKALLAAQIAMSDPELTLAQCHPVCVECAEASGETVEVISKERLLPN